MAISIAPHQLTHDKTASISCEKIGIITDYFLI